MDSMYYDIVRILVQKARPASCDCSLARPEQYSGLNWQRRRQKSFVGQGLDPADPGAASRPRDVLDSTCRKFGPTAKPMEEDISHRPQIPPL